MSVDIRKITGLLKGQDPELRCAAARVLAALGESEGGVVEALAKAASDDNGMVRTYALEALKALAKPAHVDLLLPLLDGPMKDKALPLVRELGGNPMAALKKGLADPARRMASAQSIAGLGGKAAFEVLLRETTDADFEYVKAVTNHLRGVIDGLTDEEKEKVWASAEKALSAAKERVPKVAAIRVLGYLRDPAAADALLRLTAASEHPSIRSHAIHAIAMLNFGTKKPAAALLKTLLALLDDKDGSNIVEPALQALQKLPLPDTLDLDPFLAHPSGSVRLLGVRQLALRADRDSGRRLIEMLEDRDTDVKDAVMGALRGEPKFAAMLAQFMEKDAGGERGDVYASILAGYRDGLPKDQVDKFLEKGLDLFEKGSQANWALEVAKSASVERYREALFERGMKLKKAKKLELAEKFLGQLIRDRGGSEEVRYEVAVLRLKLGAKSSTPEGRAQSYAMAMLRDLGRADGKGLVKKLKGESVLGDADLLFAGQGFVEAEGLKEAGVELLKAVAKGSGKDGKAAKAVLKGLESGPG
ncbi:MAG: HEAT repeat domain-containing protein [Candidatus Brocadiae bacterium]|nr:HEAT repeat domain-containing protein [Candidatus Brocadiia bacterium]